LYADAKNKISLGKQELETDDYMHILNVKKIALEANAIATKAKKEVLKEASLHDEAHERKQRELREGLATTIPVLVFIGFAIWGIGGCQRWELDPPKFDWGFGFSCFILGGIISFALFRILNYLWKR